MTRPVLAAAACAALALVAAGCGGGSHSPGVASLGGSGTTTTGGGADSSGNAASPGQAGGALSLKTADAAKFAACMRKNGVPNFPDPTNGGITFGPGSGIDPRSPKFQAAANTCRKLLPNGGRPTAQQLQKMQQKLLAFSACMRSHGVPSFPDPTFSNGGASLRLNARAGGVNPQSPAFQKAQKACAGNLPGNIGFKGRAAAGGGG